MVVKESNIARRPEHFFPSPYTIKFDNQGQSHLYDQAEQEVKLSTMTTSERQTYYQSRFDETKQLVEKMLGESIRIVPKPNSVEIFLESNTTTNPDGGMNYEFVYPDDTSEVDIKYVYNNHSEDNRSLITKKPLKGVTRLLLSYVLMKAPKIRKIHAQLSETNYAASKQPGVGSGRYAGITNTPMYKSRAALGFGRIVETADGNVTNGFF